MTSTGWGFVKLHVPTGAPVERAIIISRIMRGDIAIAPGGVRSSFMTSCP